MATALQAAVRSTTLSYNIPVAREGVEPTDHQGLSLAACLRIVPSFPNKSAPPMGFEPMVSTLTGRRQSCLFRKVWLQNALHQSIRHLFKVAMALG